MGTLNSAERMISTPTDGHFVPVRLRREDKCGLVFISCDDMPELFVAVKSENDIRPAIDNGLRSAFSKNGRQVNVYTNGTIAGPMINAAVCIIDHF